MASLQSALEFDAIEYIDILIELIDYRTKQLTNGYHRSIARVRRAHRSLLSNFITQSWQETNDQLSKLVDNDKKDLDTYVGRIQNSLGEIKQRNLTNSEETAKRNMFLF